MKAILLAAGVGSRISREVNRPKSLLDIGNGETLLHYTVSMLRRHDIQVGIVVGYQKDLFFEALKDLDVTFFENPFYRVSNSIASLWFAREAIRPGEDYLFANADVYLEEEILEKLLAAREDVVMLADFRRVLEGDYFFHCENGLVKGYGKEMPVERRTCEYVGAAKVGRGYIETFKKDMEAMVAGEDYQTWWETALYDHCDQVDIHPMDVAPCFWAEIDYIEDYERIVEFVKGKEKP